MLWRKIAMHNYDSEKPADHGLVCRKCQGQDFTVVYTRHRRGHIVRSRKCKTCGERMITWERPAGKPG